MTIREDPGWIFTWVASYVFQRCTNYTNTSILGLSMNHPSTTFPLAIKKSAALRQHKLLLYVIKTDHKKLQTLLWPGQTTQVYWLIHFFWEKNKVKTLWLKVGAKVWFFFSLQICWADEPPIKIPNLIYSARKALCSNNGIEVKNLKNITSRWGSQKLLITRDKGWKKMFPFSHIHVAWWMFFCWGTHPLPNGLWDGKVSVLTWLLKYTWNFHLFFLNDSS